MDSDPITKGECAVIHATVGQSLEAIERHLERMNGDVAENTKFRVQSKAVFAALIFAWGTVLIPLTAIAVAVLA